MMKVKPYEAQRESSKLNVKRGQKYKKKKRRLARTDVEIFR
jgi:hypothetical protein